ncbi:MAG: molybdate ABC transporter permease subunit [Sphaerochaeta sp.]|jgi:molybdate transport system permease protein|uniref:molybdate ABC transporter permease subunit n=1 Tax=Sphaerochaeta sp. TaxID=1972642 RepID=UPI002FC80187
MIDFSPLFISLRAALLSSCFVFVFGTLFARFFLSCNGRFASFVDTLCTLPMVLPPTVLGFFLLVLFGRNGPFSFFWDLTGGGIVFTWYATVLAAFVVSFPLMYRSARGAFEQVDVQLLWAARTLGMREWEVFLKVMLPNARPGILAGLSLSFARSLGEFGATLMIAGNIPGRTQTIPMAIYFATAGGDMHTAWIWVGIMLGTSFLSLGIASYLNAGRSV